MLKSLAGGRLFADAATSAPPRVVALHGWARSSADFRPVVAVTGGWAVDLPGFGMSPPPAEPWGSEDYAALLATALDDLAQPVVILGHSFGGRVAVRLAASRPDLVRGLVLTGVPLVRRTQGAARSPARYRLIRGLNKIGVVSDGRLERARRQYGSEDYRNAQGTMRDVLVRVVNESYEDDLRRIQCHVEMVWGANDTAAPPEVAADAATLVRSCNVVVEDGCSHLLPIERPEALVAAVERITDVVTESA